MAGRSTGKQCHLLCSQRCAAARRLQHLRLGMPPPCSLAVLLPCLPSAPGLPVPSQRFAHCPTVPFPPLQMTTRQRWSLCRRRRPPRHARQPPPLQPGSRAAPSSGSSQVVAQLVHRAAKSRLQHPAELPRSLAMPTKTYAWCGPASQTCASLKRQTGTGREGASTRRRQPCSGGALV